MWAMKDSDYCLHHNPDRTSITKLIPSIRVAKNYKLSTIQGIKNACVNAIKGLMDSDKSRQSASILVGIEKYVGILKSLKELEPKTPEEQEHNKPLSEEKKEELRMIVRELQDLHSRLQSNPYAQTGEQGRKDKKD